MVSQSIYKYFIMTHLTNTNKVIYKNTENFLNIKNIDLNFLFCLWIS